MELNPFVTPVVGLVGVVVGIAITEFIRRKNRIEQFSGKIFERRLSIYEDLFNLIRSGESIADEIIESQSLSAEQRHELVSSIIMPVVNYTDANRLYLNEELAIHCAALFMAVEDICEAENPERNRLYRLYIQQKNDAYRMISEDSGLAEINRLFHAINRPKISGPIVELLRHLRQKNNRTT